MPPIINALRGKGYFGTLRRVLSISNRYGVNTRKVQRYLAYFAEILRQYNCEATFPVPAVSLARNRGVITETLTENIEYALHGYYHIDYSQLSLDEHLTHFNRSQSVFQKHGISLSGFRSPYLRWNEHTIEALQQCGFLYDCSQGLAWDVAHGTETEDYRRVLQFYGAVSASDYPALPRWDKGLVRIPYCLPDDEALDERFRLTSGETMSHIWLAILEKTHSLGELFTLGLHPERILVCEVPLRETLNKTRQLPQGVWIARLDEIANWWKARTNSTVDVCCGEDSTYLIQVNSLKGATILTRNVELCSPAVQWDGVYQKALGPEVQLRASRRPFIGVSPASDPYLPSFLRQQGYIVEQTPTHLTHTYFLDRPRFGYQDERPLLAEIEKGDFPLVRLSRWPDAARSALCITGDIEAFSIWDYGFRFLGR